MVRKDSKQKILVVLVVLVFIGLVVGVSTMPAGILTGYGGMTAEIVGANDSLGLYPWDTDAFVDVSTGGTATVDVCQTQGFVDPTGVRMELTSRLTPISGAIIDLGTIQRPWIDPDTGLEDGSETIRARIIPMTMGITVRTMGFGIHPVYGIVFTVEIRENDGNFFEEPNETVAYIIDVYLINPPVTTSAELMQVSPTVGGRSVDGQRIAGEPVPQWVHDSVDTGGINYQIPDTADAVQAWFTVDVAQPALSFPLNARTEQEASWEVGVDVLVFGYWKVTNDPPPFNPLEGLLKAWDAFLDSVGELLATVGWVVFGGIIVVVLVIVFMIIYTVKGGKMPSGGKRFTSKNRK